MNLKISKWLEIIAFKARQKSLYFELKHYMKNNETYFRRVHYWERNMGKTYTLIKLANKFKCPIAVKSEGSATYIERMCRDLKIKNINIMPCDNKIFGKRFKCILCEEGIDIDFINEVLKPRSKCVIGYVNVDKYSNKKTFKREYEYKWIG